MNGKVVVFLSNGELFTSDDRELQFVSKRMAIINGKQYTFAPPASVSDVPSNQQRRTQPAFAF